MAEENKNPETNEQTNSTPEQGGAAENKQPEIDYKKEYEKLLADQKKLKDATDKACSEANKYKTQLREKLSEQERLEQERAEREAAKDAELEKYRTESRVNGYKSKLLECGYDLETATSMAAELPEGVSEDFFAKQKAFMDAKAKSIEAELLNKQPKLTSGSGFTGADADKAEMNALRKNFGLPPIK